MTGFQFFPERESSFYPAIFCQWTFPVLFQRGNAVGYRSIIFPAKEKPAVFFQNFIYVFLRIPAAHAPEHFINIVMTTIRIGNKPICKRRIGLMDFRESIRSWIYRFAAKR